MHRTVYQAGGGGAGRSSTEGRWELRPGAEWTFPLYSYTYCRASQGCLTRGGAQPLWQIVLAGSDDQHRPVESRFEIMLPPRPARYVDLAPTRRASPSAERPPTAGTPAPGAPASLPASTAPTGVARLIADVPAWRPGYQWEYRSESPQGTSTFVWSVDRLETVDGTEYYVVTAPEGREIYWRSSDRAYYMDKVFAGIETRYVPPASISWPLAVGNAWEARYTRERPIEQTTSDQVRRCVVERQEQLTVPAGTFETLKVVCSDPRRQQTVVEAWYAPAVKHWVKELARFDYGLRTRVLLRYRVD
jgi:hypothetical protein